MKQFLKKFKILRFIKEKLRLTKRRILLTKLKVEGLLFDAKHGVITEQKIPLDQVSGISQEENNTLLGHDPSSVSCLRKIFSVIDFNPSDYHFIDIGSGLGRTVFIASEFGFKKITGIEFCEEFYKKGKENLNRSSSKGPIELVKADALLYDYPDEAMVLFLYNPFHKEAMTALIKNIEASLRKSPRPFRMIYLNPRFHDLITEAEFASDFKSFEGFQGYTNFIIYRNNL